VLQWRLRMVQLPQLLLLVVWHTIQCCRLVWLQVCPNQAADARQELPALKHHRAAACAAVCLGLLHHAGQCLRHKHTAAVMG
jgi:hypothetical protein